MRRRRKEREPEWREPQPIELVDPEDRDRILLYPDGDYWRWRYDGEMPSQPYDTRAEAKRAALDARRGEEIVLLRLDGQVHSLVRPRVRH